MAIEEKYSTALKLCNRRGFIGLQPDCTNRGALIYLPESRCPIHSAANTVANSLGWSTVTSGGVSRNVRGAKP